MAESKKNDFQKELSVSQQNVIKNVNQFIRTHADKLEEHYYSVINKNSTPKKLARNNQIYDNIDDVTYNAELLKVSVVILTANFFECEILNYNVAKDNKIKIKKLSEGINIFPEGEFRRVDAFIMNIHGYTVLHLHAPETGSNTPCGSTDLVRYIGNNKYLNPTSIETLKDIPFDADKVINMQTHLKDYTAEHGLVETWSDMLKAASK